MNFTRMTRFGVIILAAGLLITVAACSRTQPPSDAITSNKLYEAASKEGALVVYSVTSSVQSLIDDFRMLYPNIELSYQAMDTTPLYERIISEAADGSVADIAWSSAMDLQIKLVDAGYALAYQPPEAENLPGWAIWRNQAFGTSYEPVGMVYNKDLVDVSEVPKTRAEFIELLKTRQDKYKGKVIAFDPERSGLGYMLMTQDLDVDAEAFWNLAAQMAATGVQPQAGSGAMFERIGSGSALIGYNLLGSYALNRAKSDLPNLGLLFPKDYTLVMSRVMFILADAPHPNAAKLWLNYVLSERGQQIIARAGLGSIRTDVEGELTAATLEKQIGQRVKPIAIGPGVLTYLGANNRQQFFDQWRGIVK